MKFITVDWLHCNDHKEMNPPEARSHLYIILRSKRTKDHISKNILEFKMNNSSLRNETANLSNNTRLDGSQTLVNILLGLDIASRCLSLASHLVYFIIILSIKELRAISLIYMHQVNFYGLLFILHFCAYIGTNNPVFENQTLEVVLCTMSEIAWSALKYLRSYSVLLLAVFRMVAVVNSHLFRQWVKSPKWMVGCMMVQISLCVLLTVLSKFVIQTTYGDVLCDDGYSSDFKNGIIYFASTSFLGMVIPCLLVTIIYFFTYQTVRKIDQRRVSFANIASQNAVSQFQASFASSCRRETSIIQARKKLVCKRTSHKAQLTRQFFYINLCLIGSLFSFFVFEFGESSWRIQSGLVSISTDNPNNKYSVRGICSNYFFVWKSRSKRVSQI